MHTSSCLQSIEQHIDCAIVLLHLLIGYLSDIRVADAVEFVHALDDAGVMSCFIHIRTIFALLKLHTALGCTNVIDHGVQLVLLLLLFWYGCERSKIKVAARWVRPDYR